MNYAQVESFNLNDQLKRKIDSTIHKPVDSFNKKVKDYIFSLNDVLGKGSFSTVYKGYHQETLQTVAIKVIDLKKIHSTALNQLLKSEIQTLQSMNHRNILHCQDICFSTNNCYIITQFCNGGDIKNLLTKEGLLNQREASKIIMETYEGLKYLSERNIIHRDFKTSNVLMSNGQVKIADFGFAKKTIQNFKDINIGSPLCMSPQGIIDNLYGPKTDVWAFGIFIYELFHGKNPFQFCQVQSELRQAILRPITESHLKPNLSREVKMLILDCLQIQPQKRIQMKQIQRSDYFIKLKQQRGGSKVITNALEEFYKVDQYNSQHSTEIPTSQKDPQVIFHKMHHMNNTPSNNNRKANASKYINRKRSLNYKLQSQKEFKITSPEKESKYIQDSKKKLATTSDQFKSKKYPKKQISYNNTPAIKSKPHFDSIIKQRCERISTDSSHNEGSRTHNNNTKVIRDVSEFRELVSLVHYCRILFKTIKISQKNILLNTEILYSWLLQMITQILCNIEKIQNPSFNIQQLKKIILEYKYKYFDQITFEIKSHPTIQDIKSFILSGLKILRTQSNISSKQSYETHSCLVFVLQMTELLQISMDTKNFKYFTQNNTIEDFLEGRNLKLNNFNDLLR